MASETARELEQFGGVRVTGDADAHHRVIARAFALLPEASTNDPEQRIEPVDRLADFCDHLHEPVPPRDVRDFMSKHDVKPLPRPVTGIGRQHDLRRQHAPGDDHSMAGAADERHAATQAEERRHMFQRLAQRDAVAAPAG